MISPGGSRALSLSQAFVLGFISRTLYSLLYQNASVELQLVGETKGTGQSQDRILRFVRLL